jgi:hypothetical protein
MMAKRSEAQSALFYEFDIENHVPANHLLRSLDRFNLYPERLVGDTGYGNAKMLGWLVYEHGIEPHIPVMDKSKRRDDTFSRSDFEFHHAKNAYRCPAGKWLHHYRRPYKTPRAGVDAEGMVRYRASNHDCQACTLK